MPKSLVLGNGNLLATFGKDLQMRDIYFPYVWLEEHTTFQNFHRVWFFVDGKFSWLNNPEWEIKIDYKKDTLIGNSTAINNRLGISVLFEDFVYTTHDILFRKLTITNISNKKQEVRVFFSHNLFIYWEKIQDTAQYEPKLNAVLHYRRNRYFLLNGNWEDGTWLDQYAIGKSGFGNLEGTFRDAEGDGELQWNAIEQGSVDSTIRFSNSIQPQKSKTLFFWLCAAKNYEEFHVLNDLVFKLTPKSIFNHTHNYWKKWVNKENIDFQNLPSEIVELFKKSLLIIRTQIDNRGAIIAGNDTDIMKFNRDTYSYMWPRDGAFVSMALTEAGYEMLSRNFFDFCKKVLTSEGYLMNKYHPDWSLWSSWHPKIKDGELQLPIQEDESALVLVALSKYYSKFHTIEVVQSLFNDLILKIGNWLSSYVDKKTGLPLPSYGLWEQQRDVHTFTCATVYAGLQAASFLSDATGHYRSAQKFERNAEKIRKAILKHLYSKKLWRFLKSVTLKDGKIIHQDETIDACLSHVWTMGVLLPTDKEVQQTMQAIHDNLTVQTEIGGIVRYSKDTYQFDMQNLDINQIPGNPWIITTLWEADYQIETAQKIDDLKCPLETLQWVCQRASAAGILPEQIHPCTGAPLSIAPLTWSHATFVSTVIRYLSRLKKLTDK